MNCQRLHKKSVHAIVSRAQHASRLCILHTVSVARILPSAAQNVQSASDIRRWLVAENVVTRVLTFYTQCLMPQLRHARSHNIQERTGLLSMAASCASNIMAATACVNVKTGGVHRLLREAQ